MTVQPTTTGITPAALAFAGALATLDEQRLTAKWPAAAQPRSRWYGYDDDLRGVSLLLNLKLCALTSELLSAAPRRKRAQHILAQHHRAYRDLTGALAGVEEADFDRVPAPDEWPLRTIIHHLADAQLGFSLLIGWAVERSRTSDGRPITMPREEMEPHYATVGDEGTQAEIMDRFDALHARIQRDFADLTDADLDAPNVWWEGYEIPVWFRMHRFDAHLREHTIQVDKTLIMLDRPPGEAARLARLLHQSLAELESAMMIAPNTAAGRTAALAAEFDAARTTLLGA